MLEIILKIVTNLFIILMLFWMIFYDSEAINPIKKYWIPKVQNYFIWLGLSHGWKMFSPDPYRYNNWPKVKITLKSGDFMVWEPTPTAELNVYEKLKYKKFHKFYHEVSRAKAAYHTKRDFIDYLLHKYDLKEQCEKVEIYRIHQNLHPFENQQPEPLPIYQQLIYTYKPEN